MTGTVSAAFNLKGKRVLVTGANTGIGQGIAASVARAGGVVIGVGRSAMDETQKAGLVLHELVYREALSYGHADSILTRYFVALISSPRTAG